MNELLLIPAVLVAPLAWMVMTRRWDLTLFAVMILMVYEGALRKWVFPGLHAQIYFLKDALLLIALAGFLIERRPQLVPPPYLMGLSISLLAGAVFAFLQLANPNLPSPLIWIIGFKSYFLYAVLIYMVPYVFRSSEDVEKKLKRYMFLMIPVALLGVLQFALPADHILNRQVAHDATVSGMATMYDGSRVRTASTFSYIGGFGTFLPAMFGLTLAFILSRGTALRANFSPIVLMAATCLAMFTNGSRAVIVYIVIIALCALILCFKEGIISRRVFLQAMIATVAIVAIIQFAGSEAFDAFVTRSQNSDDPMMRFLSPITECIRAGGQAPFFGTGLGTTHNSAATIMQTTNFYWLHGIEVETETSRVITEMGLPGFLIIYLPRFIILFMALGFTYRLRTPLFKALCAVMTGYAFLHIFSTVINNPTGGLYYWFGVGLMLALYRIENPAPVPASYRHPPVSVANPPGLRRIG